LEVVGMAEILINTGLGPDHAVTHALVIGVSDYPFVDGPDATDYGKQSELASLSCAARSATDVVSWLLEGYDNPKAPLASVTVLLSPSADEVIPGSLSKYLPSPCPATSAATREAFVALWHRCREKPENVALVYVAGHGVQLTKRGAVVLLQDFAAPGQTSILEAAIDMTACHAAFNGSDFASNQLWFVDACRQQPAVASRFEQIVAPKIFDEPTGEVESSPLFLAASSREAAWAQIGGPTLFSSALLAGLRGAAATGPDPQRCNDWHVSTFALYRLLHQRVGELAATSQVQQQVELTGRVHDAVVTRFAEAPDVLLRLELSPEAAASVAKASLYFAGADVVADGTTDWPIDRVIKAGLYTLTVDASPPYRSIPFMPLDVAPPESAYSIDVGAR
jgi:hypothetical protein